MSLVTIIWSMVASMCLTLALIYFVAWCQNRTNWAHLLFAVNAASTTVLAFSELWVMRSNTAAELRASTAWAHVPLFFWLVSITWFIRVHLGTGRIWLAWVITGLRGVSMLGNVFLGQLVSFRDLDAVHRIQFLGESVTIIPGSSNRLTPIAQFAALLVIVFVADATIAAWRRGDRRKALMFGGTAGFFVLASLVSAMAIIWGKVQMPSSFSQYYFGLALVMGYELSRDVLRASRLVNELQASEAGLRESEARVSLAVEAGEVDLWTWDMARDEIWASDSWRALFAYDRQEPLRFDHVLARIHPDDREGLSQALATVRAGAGRYDLEYRLLLPNGAHRWVSGRGRVEADGDGRPGLLRGAIRDVTARKDAEQETQRLRQELAHAGRVSLMGQLASALAHEINQPLGAILRNAETANLLMRQAAPDLDELRGIVEDIRKDDERAAAVIQRIRGLLKRHALETQRLDVGALVGDVAALVRGDAATRQVRLNVRVPSGLPPITGDRIHLQQVLLNLILNGMDSLHATHADRRYIGVTARVERAELVEVAVDDAGPGIPPAVLPKIFEPFFTTKPHGMGMGLAISRSIVEAHGGQLWAENKKDGGAAFRFTLRVAGAPAAH